MAVVLPKHVCNKKVVFFMKCLVNFLLCRPFGNAKCSKIHKTDENINEDLENKINAMMNM
mgnify:CR=1 FL=1